MVRTEDPQALIDWLEIRVALYGLLADCFLGKPRPQFKTTGLLNRQGKLSEGIRSLDIPTGRFLEELEKSLQNAKLYGLVISDYLRLFQPDGPVYLRPYESHYHAQYRFRSKKLAEQRAEQEVQFFYRHAGLDMKSMYPEKADHAGVELAFMKGLVSKEIQARQSGHMSLVHCYTQWQRQFLENHLAQWFGALNRQLESDAGTDFYRILAKLAGHFVRTDYNILNGARP
ncbi:molecular chaperone TorD family protein [Paradesulfitobacterium aromaticivorans]